MGREPSMLRFGIIALLLCSQLIAPALSGQFVCLAASGCICVDNGPETCNCCTSMPQVASRDCGCHEEESESANRLAEGSEDCSHIAIGEHEMLLGQSKSAFEIPSLAFALPLPRAFFETVPSTSSMACVSSLPDDWATLAVIATVVLRI